jgi:cobalt-zinc-cadmium efflux system outer membrane protein
MTSLIKRTAGFVMTLMLLSSSFSLSWGGDTVHLTLVKADSLFVKNNVQLLAQKCNVDAARAQVLQNRLWDNPTLSVNQNVYNTEVSLNGADRWFPVSSNGETNVQVQQLITIAGKRNKRIKLAEITAQKTEYQFYDLLRTLKYQLRSDFYKIYFTQQTLAVYAKEVESLGKLISAFEVQFQKGQVSKRDLLRLKASLFSLENDKFSLDNQLVDSRTDLALLLRLDHACLVADADLHRLDSIGPAGLSLTTLIDTALVYRNDLKAAEADVKFNELNVAYQKSLAFPDVQLIGGWDRNGSYVHNYNYLGLQFDVPVFNRNQGNIKSAVAARESSGFGFQGAKDQVKSDVENAYAKAMQADAIYKRLDRNFIADFAAMQNEIVKNYEKRAISLLEFIDFYDAYKQNAVQFNTLQNNRVDSFEGINFSIGKNILAW